MQSSVIQPRLPEAESKQQPLPVRKLDRRRWEAPAAAAQPPALEQGQKQASELLCSCCTSASLSSGWPGLGTCASLRAQEDVFPRLIASLLCQGSSRG